MTSAAATHRETATRTVPRVAITFSIRGNGRVAVVDAADADAAYGIIYDIQQNAPEGRFITREPVSRRGRDRELERGRFYLGLDAKRRAVLAELDRIDGGTAPRPVAGVECEVSMWDERWYVDYRLLGTDHAGLEVRLLEWERPLPEAANEAPSAQAVVAWLDAAGADGWRSVNNSYVWPAHEQRGAVTAAL